MSEPVPIQGDCDPRFSRVRELFAEQLETRELGASVALTLEGRAVIDLWGGFCDEERTRPWQRDTLVNVWSVTKGMTALCALRLIERGELELDAPVARTWPEFAKCGKEHIPVRQLLNHRAGLAAVRKPLAAETLFDWDAMCTALAEQEPWWEPGTAHGYHATTFGWLVGEVVRRVSGKSLGTFFREEVAGPLGLDFHIGLDAVHDRRVAPLTSVTQPEAGEVRRIGEAILVDPQGLVVKALANPPTALLPGTTNSRAWRAAELPALNGHGHARALARVYGALACGGELDGRHVLAPETIAAARSEESFGPDLVLQVPTRIGLGFMLSQPDQTDGRFGPNPGTFGHPGAGGALGCADPEAHLGFGYAMNGMGQNILTDPRTQQLLDAVYASL